MDKKEMTRIRLIDSLDVGDGELGVRSIATAENFGTPDDCVMVGYVNRPASPSDALEANLILELSPNEIPKLINLLQRYHRLSSSVAARLDLIQ